MEDCPPKTTLHDTDHSTGHRRIVHIHIPKTAGTALRIAFLEASQGALRVFPHYEEREFLNVKPSDYDLYSGHIGFKTAVPLGGSMITVLRDPVERFLSVYFFWRQLYEKGVERSRKTALASKYPIEEFVLIRDEPLLIEEFYNRATWQVAYGSSLAHRRDWRELGKTEREIFQSALDNLGKFAVIGTQERFAEFAAAISKVFSINIDVRKINVTENKVAASNISLHTRRQIYEWTYMDHALYQHVAATQQVLPPDETSRPESRLENGLRK